MTTNALQTEFDVEERCRCGKLRSEIHCPKCGRSNYYALKSKSIQTTDAAGNPTTLRVWSCRPCGAVFNEFQFKHQCEARFNPRNVGISTAKRQPATRVSHDAIIAQRAADTPLEEANKIRVKLGYAPMTQEEFDETK